MRYVLTPTADVSGGLPALPARGTMSTGLAPTFAAADPPRSLRDRLEVFRNQVEHAAVLQKQHETAEVQSQRLVMLEQAVLMQDRKDAEQT